jgi:hypothetical protein
LKTVTTGGKAFRERTRKIDKEKFKKAVEEKPDAYLYEQALLFGCSPQAVFLMLAKLKITRKKSSSVIVKEPRKNVWNLLHG